MNTMMYKYRDSRKSILHHDTAVYTTSRRSKVRNVRNLFRMLGVTSGVQQAHVSARSRSNIFYDLFVQRHRATIVVSIRVRNNSIWSLR